MAPSSPENPIAGLDTRIIRINPRELKILDVNARFMRHEQFQQLVDNVKRDGRLTSVPLVAMTEEGRYEVLSGNHRTQAAVEVGLTEIDVMAIDEILSPQRRVAIQLSHNAIAGEDDPAILKDLYDQLDEIDWRDYAALDDKTLDLLDQVQPASMSEANLEFQTLTIVFLPDELQKLEDTVKDAMALTTADSTWVARYAAHARVLDALAEVSEAYNVKNVATVLDLILDVFDRHKTEIVEGWWDAEKQTAKHSNWVPLSSILGLNAPAGAAATIKKAVDKVRAGDTSMPGWQAIERLAAKEIS
jgi:hypothetical protein